MNNPQFFQQSYSNVFSSVNGVPVVDKEIMKRMDNIKLQILERDEKKIKSYEIPLLNIKKCNKNNLFKQQTQVAKNLVLQKAMRNFQNVRDSIPLAKERKLKSILKLLHKLKAIKEKTAKKIKKKKPTKPTKKKKPTKPTKKKKQTKKIKKKKPTKPTKKKKPKKTKSKTKKKKKIKKKLIKK